MQTESIVENPLLRQDYPDPDVIRVEDTYYMISTTMHFMPGGVILRSYDLAHWEIAGYVFDTLDDTPAQCLAGEENCYGKGMWAGSLRYREGTFFACFSANDTHKTYLYQAECMEGPWKKKVLRGFYYDPSLFFDDDGRSYMLHGNTTIRLTELDEQLDGPKPGGLERVLVEDTKDRPLGFEGSHLYKIGGRYYAFFIHSLQAEWYRVQACYSCDSLEGTFVGGDVLCDDLGYRHAGIAQGGIVDTPEGDWYAVLFQDRGAVGRIPVLVPIRWENGNPVFGVNGKVPEKVRVTSTRPEHVYAPLFTSDDFSYLPDENGQICLHPAWQWNHTPKPALWSVTEREHTLRLYAGKLCSELTQGYNTLTQRTMEPVSEATVWVDAAAMHDGDFAGISALLGDYGAIAVTKEQGTYAVVFLEPAGNRSVRQKHALAGACVHLKCRTVYGVHGDYAEFFYEADGKWEKLGEKRLRFALDHFTGCRFALFYYATETIGGYADFQAFRYEILTDTMG